MGMAPRGVWDTPEAPGEGFWGHRALPCPSSPLKPPLPPPGLSLPHSSLFPAGKDPRRAPGSSPPPNLCSQPHPWHTQGAPVGERHSPSCKDPPKKTVLELPGQGREPRGAAWGSLGTSCPAQDAPAAQGGGGRGSLSSPQHHPRGDFRSQDEEPAPGTAGMSCWTGSSRSGGSAEPLCSPSEPPQCPLQPPSAPLPLP